MTTALAERDEQQHLAQRHGYVAQIQRAQQALDTGDLRRAELVLGEVRDDPVRFGTTGFDWHLLWRSAHAVTEIGAGEATPDRFAEKGTEKGT